MQKTNIAWTEYSWNPFCGCPLPLASDGCEKCWARDLHTKRHKAYLFGKKIPRQYARSFNRIQLFPNRLKEPMSLRKPSKIFIGSMGDLFHKDVPLEFIDKVLAVVWECSQHIFQVLTKRPERMLEYHRTHNLGLDTIPFPLPNLRLGVSVCNQPDADKFIPPLLQTPAAYRFLSVEPMLSVIKVNDIMTVNDDGCPLSPLTGIIQFGEEDIEGPKIDQVIIGCESIGRSVGRLGDFKDEADWAAGAIELTEQCKSAGLRVFVKQIPVNGKLVKDMSKFPKQLRYQVQ